MKKTIYLSIFTMLSILTMQSCLKDQEDVFERPSSLRLQDVLENTHNTLTTQGLWTLDFYPRAEYYYGGYPMIFKFEKDKVTAWRIKEEEEMGSDADDIILSDESEYKMKDDFGPVLSFDTYNDVIHYFSTPRNTSAWYQAMQGDFEFVVDSVGKDCIKVHGKKSQNTMYLRAFTGDPNDYLTKAAYNKDEFIYAGANITDGGQNVPIGFDLDYRQVVWNKGTENEREIAFCFTGDGIRLSKPITINGQEIDDFVLDLNAQTLKSRSGSVTLPLERTPGYMKYNEWLGEYTLTYRNAVGAAPRDTTFTLVATPQKKTFILKGLVDAVDLTVQYNRSLGTIELLVQRLVTTPEGYILLAVWDSATGSVSYTTTYGMRAVWNENRQLYVWTDRGGWSGHTITGFIPYEWYNGTRYAVTSEYYVAKTNRFLPLTIKKNN
ncbi:MAG: DUF4302 domain-containing protein [Prevotella sp.]|nr:DUF4302 domain-containing protein [Prevotella sp.]